MSEKKDITSMSAEELSGAVQSILENPAFAKLAADLAAGEKKEPDAPTQSGTPQLSPEMLSRLPGMMSAMAPLLSGMQGKGGAPQKDGKGGDGGDAERRKRLLSALKPYLSSTRKDAIDSILKVTEMTDLLAQFGGANRDAEKDHGK